MKITRNNIEVILSAEEITALKNAKTIILELEQKYRTYNLSYINTSQRTIDHETIKEVYNVLFALGYYELIGVSK